MRANAWLGGMGGCIREKELGETGKKVKDSSGIRPHTGDKQTTKKWEVDNLARDRSLVWTKKDNQKALWVFVSCALEQTCEDRSRV